MFRRAIVVAGLAIGMAVVAVTVASADYFFSDGELAKAEILKAREGELFERLPGGRVRCYACGHRCFLPPGQRGICKVRSNEDGRLSADRS